MKLKTPFCKLYGAAFFILGEAVIMDLSKTLERAFLMYNELRCCGNAIRLRIWSDRCLSFCCKTGTVYFHRAIYGSYAGL